MTIHTTDRSREADARYDRAAQAGLAAAANLLTREIKKAFGSTYYKGGKFRGTLNVKASIRYLTPYKTVKGWETLVGTKIIQALYWELGHNNKWTRNRERVRLWEPTGMAQKQAMRREFAKIVKQVMEVR